MSQGHEYRLKDWKILSWKLSCENNVSKLKRKTQFDKFIFLNPIKNTEKKKHFKMTFTEG